MEDGILRVAMFAPGFLIAVIFHEWSHAFVAKWYGDETATAHGRLTLNPMAHIDWLGTVIFPMIGALMGGIMFGWAKPVPINPNRFRKIKEGIFWVSFAGPLMNVLLGFLSAMLLALVAFHLSPEFYLFQPATMILRSSIMINFTLAIFNLLPIPPLDGSKMVSIFLSYHAGQKYEMLAAYSFMIFLALILTGAMQYLLAPAMWLTDLSLKLAVRLFTVL